MADLQKTVEIIFGGKNELSGVVGSIEKDFRSLDDSVNKIATPLAGVAESILKVSAAAGAMAIGGMAVAIKAAGEFGTSFNEVTTLIKETGEPIKQFEKDILSYGATSGKSLDEVNKAIYTSVSAGVDWGKSLAFVTAAEKLSIAGKSELGDTTKALIGVLNAYGAGTEQAGKYSDIMFATVQGGLTTMTELSTSLSQVTGLAANAGIPFETLSAAIATLTTNNMPTTQAMTALKAAIQSIIKPTGEAEKMAAALGIQFNATALKTKGFEGVLWDAWKATGGSTEKMAELFGSVEALNAVLILASDKTGKFKSALGEMGNAAGAVDVAHQKMADNLDLVNKRLENSFKVTLITIGKELMPGYAAVVNSFGSMFAGVKVGVDSGAFDPLFKYLDATGKLIADWLNEVAKAFPEAFKLIDFTGLVARLKDFGEAFSAMLATDKDKPEQLADAMQLVIKSIESLISVTKGIGEVFAPMVSGAKNLVEGFNSLDASTQSLMGNILGLSVAYKAFGPVASLVLMGLATDSETAARNVTMFFMYIENGINALKVGLYTLAVVFADLMRLVAGASFLPLGLQVSDEALKRTTDRVTILAKLLSDAQTDLAVSSMNIENSWWRADNAANKFKTTVEQTPRKLNVSADYKATLDPLATEQTRLALTQAFFQKDKNKIDLYTTMQMTEVMIAKAALAKEIPPKQTVTIGVQADGSSIEQAYGMILQKFPDGSMRIVQAQATLDKIALANVKAKMDEAIPKEKLVEIQAKIDETKIKEQSAIIQKSIEWKAKLDIAQVEAEAQKVVAAFKSIDNTITSTGTTLSSLTSSFAGIVGKGTGGSSVIESILRDENTRRNDALDMQKKLTEAEIDNIKARTAAIKNGDSMITINGAGLQPHLEAFMFEILAAIQVKANAEGQKFLVGL